jgi:hypothetical protein
MNKLFVLFAFVTFATSCKSDNPAATETTDSVVAPKESAPVNFLYPSTYPSDWKIGDPQNIVKVQELYKIMLSDSNYEAMLPYLADSIENVLFDNRKLKLSSKDFVQTVKQFRGGFKSLNEEFRNYVSLRSDSQNLDMVLLWIKENGVRKNGKVDSSGYQETWIFDKNGKLNYRSSYVRYDF